MNRILNLTEALEKPLKAKNIESIIDRSVFVGNQGWTRLIGDKRAADVSCSVDGLTVGMTFWDKGHSVGTISTSNLDNFADICEMWFVANSRLEQIGRRYREIDLDPIEKFLYGKIEPLRMYIWNRLEKWLSQEKGVLALTYRLLMLSGSSTVLSRLFPFTSHSHLHFSESSAVPNQWLLPHFEPETHDKVYLVDSTRRVEFTDFRESVTKLESELDKQELNIRIGA